MAEPLNTSNLSPWKDIKEMIVQDDHMVFIPKCYVKTDFINGSPVYYVCGVKKAGYHLHPAFMNNGVETDNGILIGKYLLSGNVSNLNSVPSTNFFSSNYAATMKGAISNKNVENGTADQKGWHMINIYEIGLVYRLLLIKYGTTLDIQAQEDLLYRTLGSDLVIYSSNSYSWKTECYYVDGIKIFETDTTEDGYTTFGLSILNATQTGYVELPYTLSSKLSSYCYLNKTLQDSGENYDFNDVFLPATWETTAKNIYPIGYRCYQHNLSSGGKEYAVCLQLAPPFLYFTRTGTNGYYCGRIAKFC